MKIGIVTYWKSSDNYGEQLQCYALQKYLRDQRHEAFLIRYDYDNDTIYGSRPLPVRLIRACNPKRLINHFRGRKNNRERLKDRELHPRGFGSFRDQNLTMSKVYPSIDDLRSDPPEADLYITGSDQVWNTYDASLIEMKNRLSTFFLDFGPTETKRISYAASWGRNEVPDDEKEYIRPLLARFDAVSVRERSGIDLCRQMGYSDAEMALDPVLLHDAETYRSLYQGKYQGAQEKYLFFYYLNNDGSYNIQTVFDMAEKMGLKVVYVTDDWHDDHDRSFPGITEWISLIDNAEYVVTNSYHCSIFALIFGKRFGVIKRAGKHAGMNTRIDQLFEMFGISPRYMDGNDPEVLERPADKADLKVPDGFLTPDQIIGRLR